MDFNSIFKEMHALYAPFPIATNAKEITHVSLASLDTHSTLIHQLAYYLVAHIPASYAIAQQMPVFHA